MKNPFAVKSPESLGPEEIAHLFVDVLSDFPKIRDVGHTFIHGPRGTGKSMMLRYLEPQVQLAAKKVSTIKELEYYAIHVPIRNASIGIAEIDRLDGISYNVLSEHLIVLHLCVRLLNSLSFICKDQCYNSETKGFYQEFTQLLKFTGVAENASEANDLNSSNLFSKMEALCDSEFMKTIQYLRRLAFTSDYIPYNGALFGYLDFFVPLAKKIKQLSFTPNGPLYIMIDDADNLPEGMQKILNSWVSRRTTDYLCLKISTQLNYKTFRTIDGRLIETPHDYTEVDISTIYTSGKDHYYSRIKDIVAKRLSLYKIPVSPEEFFPLNPKQDKAIERIKSEISDSWHQGQGKGYRASDDVTRYAVPEYMRRLAGPSKSSPTYSYAGFKGIVDISSGIIRWFLEPAALMYSQAQSESDGKLVEVIPHQVQDKVLKDWSRDFLVLGYEKLSVTECIRENNKMSRSDKVKKLFTLINSLGSLFRERLLDPEASERRLFSFVVSNELDEDLEGILRLGVEWGYFQKSTLGSKEGRGRKPHYILNRRLAPCFNLDPSGYAGYLSVTSDLLKIACENTERFIRDRLKHHDNESQMKLIE